MMVTKLNKLIEKRYSPVVFSSKKVDTEQTVLLIEAARWAASSRNEQPARYIIGHKGDNNYQKLFQSLSPGNQNWAQRAPLLIMAFIKEVSSYNNKKNRYAQHDLGLAIGNLMLQATEMDLYVHPMGGFDQDLVKDLFQFPDHFIPMTALAVGYLGNIEEFPEEIQKRERGLRIRRSMDKLIYSGNWEIME